MDRETFEGVLHSWKYPMDCIWFSNPYSSQQNACPYAPLVDNYRLGDRRE
ncbi:hypothetical protein Sjap_012985 [Stephania japonica]|uniref:Uncharacterized protein n=1 Tax=Stephania japonica TaxID=461633 RepID=A0AAP0NY66_9MAGN